MNIIGKFVMIAAIVVHCSTCCQAATPTEIESAKLSAEQLDTNAIGTKTDKSQRSTTESDNFEIALHKLTSEILEEEIEFEKFNLFFNREMNVQGRWKGPRYFLSQEAYSSLTLAGLIQQVAIREQSLHHRVPSTEYGRTVYNPGALNRAKIEQSLIPQMIGQQVGTAGSALEMAINYYHSVRAEKKGYGYKNSLASANRLKTELTQLLGQRAQLIAGENLAAGLKEVPQLEGKVLQDICDLTFDEYRRFHVAHRRFQTFQNSLYALDIAKFTSGWIANLIGIEGQERHQQKLGGTSGVLVTVSGALIAATPILSRGLGKLAEVQEKRRMIHLYGNTQTLDLARLEEDNRQLKLALARHKDYRRDSLAAFERRLAIYQEQSASRAGLISLVQRETLAGQRAATENVLVGQLVGDSKITSGIASLIAGYKYPHNPRANDPLSADGQIAYLCGTSIALLDNVRIQVQAEARRRQLSRDRLLPEQVYADRLDRLEELRKRISADKY